MKKIILTAMMTVALTVNAQTLMIHEKGGIARYNAAMVDSITFDEQAQMPANIPYTTQMTINAHWCALGTSITYLNDYDKQGRFEKGYMDRTMDQLHFAKMTNQGVSGGCIRSAYDKVIKADYYTIEHGINDWGQFTPVGTFDDYKNRTNNGSFAYWYRMVIDRICAVNPKAKIVMLCGSMLNGKELDIAKRIQNEVVDEARRQGDKQVYRFDFTPQHGDLGYGASWHPSLEQHKKMAVELTAYLKSLMKW